MLSRRKNHYFQLNASMDVWTLGMILLHCLCLEFRRDTDSTESVEEIVAMYKRQSGPSLVNVDEELKENLEFDEPDEEEEDQRSDADS